MTDAISPTVRDAFPRYFLNLPAQLVGPAGTVPVWTSDIAGDGARVDRDGPGGPEIRGGSWVLEVLALGSIPVRLTWHRAGSHGLEFLLPDSAKQALDRRLSRMLPGA